MTRLSVDITTMGQSGGDDEEEGKAEDKDEDGEGTPLSGKGKKQIGEGSAASMSELYVVNSSTPRYCQY